MTVSTEHLLESARAFAIEAGAVTLRYFGGVVPGDYKADGTPVTQADREAEMLLRQRIGDRFPDHGILGEEFGETGAGSSVRWILDPIDGTLSFSRGVPLYGVLIGVEVDRHPVVGVAHFPALRETVSAGRGLGCDWNGASCSVSEVESIRESLVLATDEVRIRADLGERWASLSRAGYFSRTWGDCYGHVLVATGRAEVMVDSILSAWDAAPLLTILTEAGGTFTDTSGNATIHGESGVSTNGILHDEVIRALTGTPTTP